MKIKFLYLEQPTMEYQPVISNKGTIVDKIEKGESTVLNSYAYTGTEREAFIIFLVIILYL